MPANRSSALTSRLTTLGRQLSELQQTASLGCRTDSLGSCGSGHDERDATRKTPIQSKEGNDHIINRQVANDRCKDLFAMFVASETAKHKRMSSLPGDLQTYAGDYADALCALTTPKPEALAKLALGIGNCGAMTSLQQAIESIRSNVTDDAFGVGRKRSSNERLAAIWHLDLRMAHLRIARRLHIYHLYLEATAGCVGEESGRFVFETPQPRSGGSSEPSRYGNPRNINKAKITESIKGQTSRTPNASQIGAHSRSRISKLRRLGHRLQMLGDRFGMGVFAFLGDDFSENMYVRLNTCITVC